MPDANPILADAFLDLRGHCDAFCLLKVLSRVKGLEPGQALEVLGTDPGAYDGLPRLCREGRVELIFRRREAGYFRIRLLKLNAEQD